MAAIVNLQRKRLRILLADDFGPFRSILKAAFPVSGDVELAAEASTGAEAIERARTTRPDLVILDYRMPEGDGVAAAVRILEHAPNTLILMASLSVERQYVLRSLAAGVHGYLSKDDAAACLGEAIETLLQDRGFLSPRVAWEVTRSAPPAHTSAAQQTLGILDQEAPALLSCAHRVQPQRAMHAVEAAFDAYWMALRHAEPIADPQTWLLLSVAAFLSPPATDRTLHKHPPDTAFADFWTGAVRSRNSSRLEEHIATCRSCYLSWTLAAYGVSSAPDPVDLAALRATLAGHLAAPSEPELFLTYARRKAKVARLAASELDLLLGSSARGGWLRREDAAGSWLNTLLGSRPGEKAAV